MLQSSNPIAQQSQRWIVQALLDLMGKEEYDRISVTRICSKAGLDRRTFYRNFESKNDVLEHYIRFLGEEYINMYTAIGKPDKYTAAKVFFEFWSKHLDFIRNIKKCGLSDFAFQRFGKFTREHTELLVGDEICDLPSEYVFAYRIGGFWNVMLTWADDGEVKSADEMAKIMSRIA